MIYNVQHISKQTEEISMQKLKFIRSFCLLLALVVGAMPSIVGAQMRTVISSLSGFPLQDNYCDGNYRLVDTSGISADNSNTHLCPEVSVESVPSITVDGSTVRFIVDWILVELRAVSHGGTPGSTNVDDANAASLIARKPAFLLSNGRIVEASTYTGADPSACTALTMSDNCPDVEFSEGDVATAAADNDLYVVVRHRNHLDIISANRITESDDEAGVYAYDFSSAATQARNGRLALKLDETNSVYVMPGGDAVADGTISLDDFNTRILPDDGQSGYIDSDTTFDDLVSLEDYNLLALPNDARTIQIP